MLMDINLYRVFTDKQNNLGIFAANFSKIYLDEQVKVCLLGSSDCVGQYIVCRRTTHKHKPECSVQPYDEP